MSLHNDLDITLSGQDESSTLESKSVFFKSWLDQFQLIHHLILYSNILMVFQGKKCSGKTTYIKGLKEKLPQDFLCQSINASQVDNVDALNLAIRQQFSLNSLSVEQDPLDNDLLTQIITRQKHCLLIIDDAHKLSDLVITSLLTLLQSQEQRIYFHCLLVGDPLLTSRLTQPPFTGCDDSFMHFIEMPELEVVDARSFLTKKFSSLGTLQVSSLSDDIISELLLGSGGNLTQLTELTRAKLSGIPIKKISSLSVMPNYQKRGMATLAVIVCLTLFTFVRSPSSTVEKTQKLALPSRMVAVEHSRPEIRLTQFKQRPELPPTIELTNPSERKVKSSYVPMSMIPKHTLLSQKTLKTKEHFANVNLTEKSVKQEKVKGEKASFSSATYQQPLKEKINNKIELPLKGKSHLAPSIPPLLKSTPLKKTMIQSKVVPKKIPPMTFYGKGYGIQLIAATDINALKRYARKYHVYTQAQYFTKKTKGKSWYMLVLGDYSSRAEAKKAQLLLSAPLKKKKLWIRSIKGLKQIK